MNSLSDQQLLSEYTGSRSEPAFAELVRRYVDLVYSAALRMVCDSHLAEDVTQSVFMALARSAPQLVHCPVLSGWLHRTAQNLAANTVRSEVRRRAREQEASIMKDLLSSDPDAPWNHIAPELDGVLGELNELDRDAILLRYFERKSAREIAATLGITDDAAQKRVNRAVERLRELFAKRGLTVGASALVGLLSANAVQAAPISLNAAITTAAALTAPAMVTTSTATVTKALAMTTLQKAVIAATLLAAVGTGLYQAREASSLRSQVKTLLQAQPQLDGQIQDLTRERDDALRQLAALRDENERLNHNATELLRLRGEVAQLKNPPAQNEDNATESTLRSWVSRVSQLKRRLEQSPDAKIPELQFVSEQDWLNAAKGHLETEADYRRALSAIRGAGENKVAPMYKKALKGYMLGNNGQFPTDLAQLQPYFDTPLDEAIIQRWSIVPASVVKSLGMGGDSIITQKSPVDEVFDTRFGIGPNGYGSTDFLSRELASTMNPVREAFRAAHGGQWPDDNSQLLPYVTTPDQKAALEKLMLRDAGSK